MSDKSDEILQSCNKCNPRLAQTIYQLAQLLPDLSDVGIKWWAREGLNDPLYDTVELTNNRHGLAVPVMMFNTETQVLLLYRASRFGGVLHGQPIFAGSGSPTAAVEPDFPLVRRFFDTSHPAVARAMQKNEDDRQFLLSLANGLHACDPTNPNVHRLYDLANTL